MPHTKPSVPKLQRGKFISNGLVVHWPVTEGSGTTLYDISGGDYHAQLYNMEPVSDWVGSPYGLALKFDGANEYAASARPPSITSTGNSTLTMWAKYNGTVDLEGLFAISDGTNQIMLGYWWSGGNGFVWRGNTSNNKTTSLTSDPDITLWHHWAFVKIGETDPSPIYVDGVNLTADDKVALSDYDLDAIEIARGLGGSYYAPCSVSDIRLYNRELSSTEIARIAYGFG
jgi:hypothetical protein